MPDWVHYVRRHLRLDGLGPDRETRILEDLAGQLEEFYLEALRAGAGEQEAAEYARQQIPDWSELSRSILAAEGCKGEPSRSRGLEYPPSHPAGRKGLARLLADFGADIRYGLRLLLKSPGFSLIAILTLAVGIGAGTAIFTVVNGILFKPLPFPDPDRIVAVHVISQSMESRSVSYPDFVDWRSDSHSFQQLAAFNFHSVRLRTAGRSQIVDATRVSAGFFSVLGVKPIIGRTFSAGEDRRAGRPVTVISQRLWKQGLGADPRVLGSTVLLDGKSSLVVGVVPDGLPFLDRADIYTPIGQWGARQKSRRDLPQVSVIGRLKAGLSLDRARSDMARVSERLEQLHPHAQSKSKIRVLPLREEIVGNTRATLLTLFAAVGCVLLIACANVAGLLLARGTARRDEYAIRMALGARRERLIRQLLTESVLLAVLAGMFGIGLGMAATRLFLSLVPAGLPRLNQVHLDGRVLAFAALISILTAALSGLVPALKCSRENLLPGLRDAGRWMPSSGGLPQKVLAVAEVALAFSLLTGAGLMIQTMRSLLQVDPGFNPKNVLTMQVALPEEASQSAAQTRAALDQLLARVRRVQGVRAAALTEYLPLNSNADMIELRREAGSGTPPDQKNRALLFLTSPDYLEAMGIPLLKGRFFEERDDGRSAGVVVIDEVLARSLFGDGDPLGQRLSLQVLGPVQIVGVARHIAYRGLDRDAASPVRNQLYVPIAQLPDPFLGAVRVGMTLTVRTLSDPLARVSDIRQAILGPRKDAPVYGLDTLQHRLSNSLARRRFAMFLLSIFSGLALVLATLGIYGVISYSVNRRTHEFGLRMALGAQPADLLHSVLREGLIMGLMGVGIGLPAGVGLARLASSLLYGVRPVDPLTLSLAFILLLASSLLAGLVPARRATRVDPLQALHNP